MTTTRALRAETAAVVRLAGPITLIQLGTMLMGTVDVMMLGRRSELDLACGGVGNALAFGLLVFPLGLLGALDPLVSQAFGAGNAARLARYFKQGLVIAAAVSVPVSLVMWDARPILTFAGQPPAIADGAAGYLKAVLPGNLALLLYTALQRTLQATSVVRPAVVAMVIANVANLAADYALIFGHWGFPALGVAGAGWATSVARWTMVICLAAAARRPLARYASERVAGLARLPSYATFAAIGTPIGAHVSLEYWLFGCVALTMGHLGAREAASHQVALNLAALSYMVALGFAEAAATRVGNAIGRREMTAARRSAAVCLGLGTAVMVLFGAVFFLAPRLLVRLYTPESGVIALASTLVEIAAFFEIFDGVQVVSGGILRGAADTRVPAALALVGYWLVGLPLGLALAFGAGMGPQGLWWGLTLGLASVAVLLVVRLVRRFRTEIAAVA